MCHQWKSPFAWNFAANCGSCGNAHRGNANEGVCDVLPFRACWWEGITLLDHKRVFSNLQLDLMFSASNLSL